MSNFRGYSGLGLTGSEIQGFRGNVDTLKDRALRYPGPAGQVVHTGVLTKAPEKPKTSEL